MNRLMLFAVLLLETAVVFCQAPATPPGSSQVPGKASIGEWPFNFNIGQPGQTALKPKFKSLDCNGLSAIRTQASGSIDFDHLFGTPCAGSQSHVVFLARNENSFSLAPLVVQPHPKGEPIPTQWPNAKIERIPTQWPSLKLQPINGGSPDLVPAQASTK